MRPHRSGMSVGLAEVHHRRVTQRPLEPERLGLPMLRLANRSRRRTRERPGRHSQGGPWEHGGNDLGDVPKIEKGHSILRNLSILSAIKVDSSNETD